VQQGKHHYWKGWNGIWIHFMTFAIKTIFNLVFKTISSREIVIKSQLLALYENSFVISIGTMGYIIKNMYGNIMSLNFLFISLPWPHQQKESFNTRGHFISGCQTCAYLNED